MSAAVGTDGALNGMMRCALQTRVPRGAQVKNLLSKVKLGKEKEVKEIIGRNPAILKDAFDVQGNSVLHLAALNGCPVSAARCKTEALPYLRIFDALLALLYVYVLGTQGVKQIFDIRCQH